MGGETIKSTLRIVPTPSTVAACCGGGTVHSAFFQICGKLSGPVAVDVVTRRRDFGDEGKTALLFGWSNSYSSDADLGTGTGTPESLFLPPNSRDRLCELTWQMPDRVWRFLQREPQVWVRVRALGPHSGLSMECSEPTLLLTPAGILPSPPVAAYSTAVCPRLTVAHHWLQREGDSSPVVLRGVNLSGMQFHPPFWDNAANDRDEFDKDHDWADSVGANDALLEWLRNCGANILRVTINQQWALEGIKLTGMRDPVVVGSTRYLEALDSIIRRANQRGIYVLLGLHTLKLHPVAKKQDELDRETGERKDRGLPPLGGDEMLQKAFSAQQGDVPNFALPDHQSPALWALLGTRYRDWPGVMFDLFNEPGAGDKQHDFGPSPERANVLEFRRFEWRRWVRYFHILFHGGNEVAAKCGPATSTTGMHGSAVLFVAGFGGPVWASSLKRCPIGPEGDDADEARSLKQLVYKIHIYWRGGVADNASNCTELRFGRAETQDDNSEPTHSTSERSLKYLLTGSNAPGSEQTSLYWERMPVFVGEWGAETYDAVLSTPAASSPATQPSDGTSTASSCRPNPDEVKAYRDAHDKDDHPVPSETVWSDWLKWLVTALEWRRRKSPGMHWSGPVGWAAWSIGTKPHIIRRENRTKNAPKWFLHGLNGDYVLTDHGTSVVSALKIKILPPRALSAKPGERVLLTFRIVNGMEIPIIGEQVIIESSPPDHLRIEGEWASDDAGCVTVSTSAQVEGTYVLSATLRHRNGPTRRATCTLTIAF